MAASSLNTKNSDCPLAGVLAARLRDSRELLVRQWLDRIAARVTLPPNKVFPTKDLLDHVPLLIDGIARYLEDPAGEVSAEAPVVGKAMELGALRHAQGFDAYEILKEYELLGGILFNYLAEVVDQIPEPCEKSELLTCGHRLFRAIALIQKATVTRYLRLADEKVSEREDRLRAFSRMISHEIKNHVGAILGAGDVMIEMTGLSAEEQLPFKQIIVRNARAMKSTLQNLVELSRLEKDARAHRHVRLPQAAAEACRELREMAQAADVKICLSSAIPEVEVNAAVVELALTNYLSNAIKYAKENAEQRVANVTASRSEGKDGLEVIVRVQDNGLGVPEEERAQLFERFYRAHSTVTGTEGTGLGLSIVREMVESVGGRAWAEFPEEGSVFCFALPLRREEIHDRRGDGGSEASDRSASPSA